MFQCFKSLHCVFRNWYHLIISIRNVTRAPLLLSDLLLLVELLDIYLCYRNDTHVFYFLCDYIYKFLMHKHQFIWQVNARKCIECGQPLPQSYQPPADEDWSTGICGCAEDPESCKCLTFKIVSCNIILLNSWHSECLS